MSKKLLIDASHTEEVRVAVIENEKLEEFDSETTNRKLLKGNIYLAKVMRVEPSLQAAFVEYGSGRQGFLPFSEIHPDYYQIPVSDREKVLAESIKEELSEETIFSDDFPSLEQHIVENESESLETVNNLENTQTDADQQPSQENENIATPKVRGRKNAKNKSSEKDDSSETPAKPHTYRIQEVIKRRQILLIQVIKEERGNKGAAVTTYLSLAGRYCVLMPNAGKRNGGISKKIGDVSDRSRLKKVIETLNVPEGMSLIVRTAGQERRKTEIKRDYEYLVSVWEKIRELTLKSVAPALIHQEVDLIKRVLRDMYDNDIDEILIEGDESYKSAKKLMKMMIPSHSKKVQHYKNENIPLFHAYNVEKQLDDVINPICPLPSGGSIVIHITEALVAIDINSGKSTKERNIDDTALNTNLEAADEIARQLRLRDLAGLIVIDFIDMYENKHIQQVERRLKEALKGDRARIQLGRISQFGLMELSRQRLRPSLVESYSTHCQHCHGSGFIRSIESTALQILRAVEGEAIKGSLEKIVLGVPDTVDLYLLNQKRDKIVQIESRFNLKIIVEKEHSLLPPLFHIQTFKKQIIADEDIDEKVPEPIQETKIEPSKQNHQHKKHKNHNHNNKKTHHQKQTNEKKENIVKENPSSIKESPNPQKEEEKKQQDDAVKNNKEKHHKKMHPYRSKRFKKHSKNNTDNAPEKPVAEKSSIKDSPTPSNDAKKEVIKKDNASKVVPIEPKTKSPENQNNPTGVRKKKEKSWLRRLLET